MDIRAFLFLVVLQLSSFLLFSQSCIIYKKEKDGIFIGTDTRMVSYGVNESTGRIEPSYLSVCKIDHVDSIHFAVTGFAANIALDEARKVIQDAKPFSEAVSQYATSFGQKIADMLETTRQKKPDFYKKTFSAGSILGGSVFFYFEKAKLIGRVVKIVLVSRPSEKATITTRNDVIDSIGMVGSSIGVGNILFNGDIWKRGAVIGINNLVRIEKMASSKELEGTTDILFVSAKNETEWVQRTKCQ